MGDASFLNRFCDDNGFVAWFYTSPKENINVENAANALMKRILAKAKRLETRKMSLMEDGDRYVISLTNRATPPIKNKKCC